MPGIKSLKLSGCCSYHYVSHS